MKRAVQIAIAVALLVIVAAVLISPAVDLAPTALRAALWCAALLASLAVLAIEFSGVQRALLSERVLTRVRLLPAPSLIPLIDFACARLC